MKRFLFVWLLIRVWKKCALVVVSIETKEMLRWYKNRISRGMRL